MTHWLLQKLRDNGIFVATADESTWREVVKASPNYGYKGETLHAKLAELCLVPLALSDWSLVGRWAQAAWDRVADSMRYYDTCPFCGNDACQADWVDNGVADVQCGPFHCYQCGATEMGPERRDSSRLTEEERNANWYKANNADMTCAPTVGGVLVGDHRVAKVLYEVGLLDPPKEVAPLPMQITNNDIDWNKVGDDDFPIF